MTGSFSTINIPRHYTKCFKKLIQETYDFNIKIICNKKPSLRLANIQYIEWDGEMKWWNWLNARSG